MDDEDSYSYSLGAPPLIAELPKARTLLAQSSSLQKRSFQDLCGHALLLQCFNYFPVHQKNCISKRVKPPVPRFEDSYKKIKQENFENPSISTYPVNGKNPTEMKVFNDILAVNNAEGSGYTCGSNTSDSSHKVKVIKVIPETQPYKDLIMATFGKVQAQEPIKTDGVSLSSVKVEEQEDVKIEDETNNHAYSGVKVKSATTSSSSSLDRKDMKKLQKFIELCEDYQSKLNISNASVFEKFRILAILTIPKLPSHFKSKPFEAVAAAILLYACREVDYPITLKQIVSITDSKEKLINKCVFSLKEILPSNAEVKHFKAGEFINVLADKLKLGNHVRVAAIKIWENIERLNFMKSIHAVTLAACCLKFACSLSDSDQAFEDLALAAGITKMTLKNMYRELFPYRFYFITADCMLRDPKELKIL